MILKNKLSRPMFNTSQVLLAAVLITTGILVSVITAFLGYKISALFLGIFIALPIVYACVAYPKFGIIVLIVIENFIFLFIKMGVDFPLGTLVDIFQAILIIGFLIAQKNKPNWKIYNNPVTIMITLWIIYNLMQVANPFAVSVLAWLYTIRSVAASLIMYYVYVYNVDSKAYIKTLLKVWLGIAFFAGLYAAKQEYVGFFKFEDPIYGDELTRLLLFIDGHWRKFSIYSDPVVYAYNMAIAAVICFGLLLRPIATYKRVILGGLCLFFLDVMLFSGTRGANVLFPVALALYAILNFNKKVMIFSVIMGMLMLVLIFMPTTNQSLVRFQSTFQTSTDPSFLVRKRNQKMIQPYIQTHPIGGGLGSVGAWGVRFAPYSLLAQFPPDSGYVRVAVELGTIGLFLFCLFMFTALKEGIINFFRIRDPELKNYCLIMLLVLFALNMGNYPQEAIVQFPSNLYFCLSIAIITATYRIDKELIANQPVL